MDRGVNYAIHKTVLKPLEMKSSPTYGNLEQTIYISQVKGYDKKLCKFNPTFYDNDLIIAEI